MNYCSTPAYDLVNFIEKSHSLKDKRLDIKSDSKPCTKPKNWSYFSIMNQTLVIQILLWSSDRVRLYFGSFVIKVAFSFKSRGGKKLSFSPKEAMTLYIWSMNIRWLLLITNVKKLQFCFLRCKVMAERRWLSDFGIHSNSFIWRQKLLFSFSHCFIINKLRLEISLDLGSTIIRLSHLKF